MQSINFEEALELAKYAGSRFDLVQAGGGNLSIKEEGNLYIKSSGISLSDIESPDNCAILQITPLVKLLDTLDLNSQNLRAGKKELEELANSKLKDSNLTPERKPSIETFFHLLGKKYVLHTHPILVNSLVIMSNASDIVNKLFPNSLLIDYCTPGIELSIEINKKIKEFQKISHEYPEVIFLKNHGLIVSADTKEGIIDHYEEIINILEKYFNIKMTKYRVANDIAQKYSRITGRSVVAYVSNDNDLINIAKDNQINTLLLSRPIMPDQFVYNGVIPCPINSLDELEYKLGEHKEKYIEWPKVVLYDQSIYFIARNMKKAIEMEQVFRSHILAIMNARDNIDFLTMAECEYLASWDAEIFRQKL